MKRVVLVFVLASLLTAAPCPALLFGKKKQEAAPASASSQKVEIFVTSWCPYCTRLESFLKDRGVPYTRYDVESDERGARLFSEMGGEGVPVTRVGKQVIHGFDPEGVLSALGADG